MQPQGHIQVLLNVLRGFNVQAALDAPRFCIDAEPIAYGGSTTSKVFIEEGISVGVVDELRGTLSMPPTNRWPVKTCANLGIRDGAPR
jgi:gamma-glutamyltranspeptidase